MSLKPWLLVLVPASYTYDYTKKHTNVKGGEHLNLFNIKSLKSESKKKNKKIKKIPAQYQEHNKITACPRTILVQWKINTTINTNI